MVALTEADVEQAALDWLSGLGWALAHGPDMSPETPDAEEPITGRWCWSDGAE